MTLGSIPRLVAITDFAHHPDCMEQAGLLCAAAAPGAVAILLRDKETSVRARFEWGERLRESTRQNSQALWVAERLDLAQMLGADGVHLPADGLRPAACRRVWGGCLSRACHDSETLADEDWAALDCLVVSPVMAARKGRAAITGDGLSRRISDARAKNPGIQAIALGGITSENAEACLESGAAGVAAISAVWRPEQRGALLRALGIARC